MRRVPRTHRRGVSGQRGQTTTEYMMVIAVLVIALAGVSYSIFFNKQGDIAQGINSVLATGGSSEYNIPRQINRGYVNNNP